MKKIKFYLCSNCGNILWGTGEAEISCCGRKLASLDAGQEDESHRMHVEEIEDDYYLTLNHEMNKTHYISFIAYTACDRVLLIKLYPEQEAEIRIPRMAGGRLYACCNKHGLWMKTIL